MSARRRTFTTATPSDGLLIDLFAGGGGASVGIEAATGRTVDVAINHSPTALKVHHANHPRTRHLVADIWDVRPLDATGGRPVYALWASPDCTHFSVAKGGKPRKKKIRSLAWAVVRWAADTRPSVIFLENVQEFQGWGPLDPDGRPIKDRMGESFRRWKAALVRLGYVVEHRVLDASLYGAPTRRRRLFLIARCDGQPIVWPEPTHGPGRRKVRTAAECIDWTLPCPSIFDRKRPLADKTLRRIAQGIRRFVLESPSPFVVKVNHGGRDARAVPSLIQTGYGERKPTAGSKGQAPRVLDLEMPLGTIVAGGQKHALVAAFLEKHFGAGGPAIERPFGTGAPLAAVTLANFRGTSDAHPGCADVAAPLPTVTAKGTHVAEVCAFLTAYYGTNIGNPVDQPTRTITAKDRLGLVTVSGVDYRITDIGMRMLEPHELLRAQFGTFAADYDLSPAKTKADKVRLIGNSVCPQVAEALVAANLGRDSEERAA